MEEKGKGLMEEKGKGLVEEKGKGLVEEKGKGLMEEKEEFNPTDETVDIRNVWRDNLEAEFKLIRPIIDSHRYIAMDTEYPGVVDVDSARDRFKNMIQNVNKTKIIQVGLTFMNEEGFPPIIDGKYCVWQFNFRDFNIESDAKSDKSIKMLRTIGCIDFDLTRKEGALAADFCKLLIPSGAVQRDAQLIPDQCCTWVSFQGAFDFGYLLKALTGDDLADDKERFYELMETYFPEAYDMKQVWDFGLNKYGGLSEVSQELGINRVGNAHQAGSDSLVTGCVFMKLKKANIDPNKDKYKGVLYGI